MSNKEKENMYKDLNIEDFHCRECFLGEMIELSERLEEGENIDIIANSSLIEYLFVELVKEGFKIGMVDFDGLELDYYGEYLLTIDYDNTVWIEPALRDGEPYNYCAKYVYFYEEDVSQLIIDHTLKNKNSKFPTLFGFEDEYAEEDLEDDSTEIESLTNSETVNILKSKDNKTIEGFHKSWSTNDDIITTYSSYSYYSNDEDNVKSKMKDFGIKY